MDFEPEIKAMQEVHSALQDLDNQAKMRVINWVLDKFSLNGHIKNSQDGHKPGQTPQSDEEPIDLDQY